MSIWKIVLATLICTPTVFVHHARADGDVIKGEQAFKKCAACHSVNDKTKKIGPHLVGLVGRPIASTEGFTYSTAMLEFAKSIPAWDEASLQAYLENPRKTVAGTKMAFAGIKKQEERDDLIAFLKSK